MDGTYVDCGRSVEEALDKALTTSWSREGQMDWGDRVVVCSVYPYKSFIVKL